jgi:1-deoxy-D-xylulose-5-phosphate reductoisomerase
MTQKNLSILGSTGSIGESTLSLVRDFPQRWNVVGLAAGRNVKKLHAQIQAFKPDIVSVQDEESRQALLALGVDKNLSIGVGPEGACEVARLSEADTVMSAIVGASGLKPTFAAIQAGKTILLANKESMVVSGAWMNQQVKTHNATLLPVDSEHSAIFQCLQGAQHQDVRKIMLTASGGPFFLRPEIQWKDVTIEDALNHPNWSMGPKITIDSATMMNKGLEVIEAKWLFDLDVSQIEVVVHPQSIIHSMVEFQDGSTLSQMGIPHMRAPIAYAMSYPDRYPNVIDPVDFTALGEMTFFPPDLKRYPTIALAYQALEAGNTHPAVLNGANETAVEAFLNGQIDFQGIFNVLEDTLNCYQETGSQTLEQYVAADQWGRDQAKKSIAG